MKLEERPVVLLTVTDTPFATGTVQPPSLHLGRHLPAEGFAVGRGRHHRADQLPGSAPPLLPSPPRAGLGRRGRLLRTSRRRPAARFQLGRQARHLYRLQEFRGWLRLGIVVVFRRRQRQATGHFGFMPAGRMHAARLVLGP